ncbi:MltG/YceG/YrrL family protein [Bacillus fonticola]|uniref:hypothetical protein n=1 Tax=Bacillus fonticola TaxID=2728853 RepID=UPI0014742841|nr:hypothetical protein [Bacillus fonticola]
MNRGRMQGFAIGLCCAGSLLVGWSYLNSQTSNNEAEKFETFTQLQEENAQFQEKIRQLEQEVASYEKNTSETEESTPSETTKIEESENNPPSTITILPVVQGMSSQDVYSSLVELGILEDPSALEDFMESKGWATNIQIGRYEVHSEMSVEDLALLLTGN